MYMRSSSDVPALHACRQSVESDLQDIQVLQTATTIKVFGDINLSELIEKSTSRSLINVERKLVAFVALLDHPNLPVLSHQCSWQNWIGRYYRLKSATPWNTLFIHYLAWDNKYPDFFESFLKSLYKNSVHLQNILIVTPPGIEIFSEISSHFIPIHPQEEDAKFTLDTFTQTVYLNCRLNVMRKLIIHRASEEDNIDVQPMLLHQYDALRKVFGHFKVEEVIDLQDKNKSILVAEKSSEVTVGTMVLTTDVDYNHINDFFYLPTGDGSSLQPSRSLFSKLTLKRDSLDTSGDYDPIIFKQEMFKDDGEEDSISDNVIPSQFADTEDLTSIYLYEDERHFRIVDPAMEYLMSTQTRPPRSEDMLEEHEQVRSTVSSASELTTYYGRPSWASVDVVAVKDPVLPVPIADRPTYNGPRDAFMVALFALHPDLDERYAFDLLEAAFECYPEKHCCFLFLPTFYQASPLTRHFVRLTPELSRDFPHELYIAHRNSVFSDFSVRPLCLVDCEPIADMLENVSQGRKVMKAVVNCLSDNTDTSQSFVLECEGCIVGFAVVSHKFGLQHLLPHFRLEELMYKAPDRYNWDRHGLLRHALVSTLFLRAAPFFLRQIMHQMGLESLSYCLFPADLMFRADASKTTVLGELCPVRPRKRIQYNLDSLDIYRPEETVTRTDNDYALFITTVRLLEVPKLELNYRLVIVGASDTALSFLEHLIFKSSINHIRYNNLTLISIHGFPLDLGAHKAGEAMSPHGGLYNNDYLTRLGLRNHVNVLYGVVTVINRQEKMVCLNDQRWLRYDYLFLFTGVQFCKPMLATGRIDRGGCHKSINIREIHDREYTKMGENLFLVNTTTDAAIALNALRKRVVPSRKFGKIIVHGNCLNIYTCTKSLLMSGVPGHKIVIVENSETCVMCGLDINTSIEKAVVQSLEELGVSIYHGYRVVNWKLRQKFIHKVLFHTDTNSPLVIDCLAMFYFGPKVTSAKTYSAVVSAGVVYNNGIIINSRFRTNDTSIYAAGPGTRYSGRYHDSQANHWYYSSREVGRLASEMFRKEVEPRPEYAKNAKDVLPGMSEPVVLVAKLPGDWNYLRVSAPGRPLPLECQLNGQGDCGAVLVTGDPVEPGGPGYFQLSLSVYGTVREIACLSKKEIPHNNLQCLYGKHERLLNNILERYNLGLIQDLYAFFSQPWAYALYTTGFNQLEQQCAEVFRTQLCNDQQETIFKKYTDSTVPIYVENLTLKYVSEHKEQLPMYLRDDHIAAIKRSYSSSPLHKELAPRHQ